MKLLRLGDGRLNSVGQGAVAFAQDRSSFMSRYSGDILAFKRDYHLGEF